jgi:hypothetical protein
MGAQLPNEITMLEWLETTIQAGIDIEIAEVTAGSLDSVDADDLTDDEKETLMLSRVKVLIDPNSDHGVEEENENEDTKLSEPTGVVSIEIDTTNNTQEMAMGNFVYGETDFAIYIMVTKTGRTLREYKKDIVLIRNFLLNLFLATGQYVGINSCEFSDFDGEKEGLDISTCLMSITLKINKNDYSIN